MGMGSAKTDGEQKPNQYGGGKRGHADTLKGSGARGLTLSQWPLKWSQPIEADLTNWREHIGECGAEQRLAQTLQTGLKTNMIRAKDLKRINVDTTVQEKEIRPEWCRIRKP